MRRRKLTRRKKKLAPYILSEHTHFAVCFLTSLYFLFNLVYFFSICDEHRKTHNEEWESLLLEPMISIEDRAILFLWSFCYLFLFVINICYTETALSYQDSFVFRQHLVVIALFVIEVIAFLFYSLGVVCYHPMKKKYPFLSIYSMGLFAYICGYISHAYTNATRPTRKQRRETAKRK